MSINKSFFYFFWWFIQLNYIQIVKIDDLKIYKPSKKWSLTEKMEVYNYGTQRREHLQKERWSMGRPL